MIGDDDGVNPEILDAAAWASENNLDSLAMRSTAQYLWQGTGVRSTFFTKVNGATLTILRFGGGMKQADLEAEMHALVRNGGLCYLDYNLPKLYHGLVHRRCLEEVRSRTGAYLGGLSPDIYASLAVACIARRVVVTDYPLTIPGACGASTSVTEGAIKKHSTRLEDAPHFRDRGSYQWSEQVPRVYTSETIWVDSAIAALRAMGRADLIAELNLPKLAAHCLVANRKVARRVLKDTFRGMRDLRRDRTVAAFQLSFHLLALPTVKFVRRAINRALMMLGVQRPHRIEGAVNMVEVSHALTSYLHQNGRSFSKSVMQARLDAPSDHTLGECT